MSDKKISYLNKTFDDYKESLINYTKKYYPELANSLTDSSIGTWLIELASAIGDNLSYYIDQAYNETILDNAQKVSSIYSLARSNGFKIPGPKGAMTEVKFTCKLPYSSTTPNSNSSLSNPSYSLAPVIKKGAKLKAANGQIFETTEDVDFSLQFGENGESNRTVTPMVDNNNNILYYNVSKTCVATAGTTKIYKILLQSTDITPFMEILIPDSNVMNVESVILKDGNNFQSDPSMDEFMMKKEFVSASGSNNKSDTYRFFEVESLSQQYIFDDDTIDEGNKTYEFQYNGSTPTYSITKGQWNPITQKFITEYTDKGYLKLIFGSGEQVGQDSDISKATDFSRHQITKMVKNNMLGKLPKEGCTMYILYRTGGGASSNVAANSIRTIVAMDASPKECQTTNENKNAANAIISAITVTNTIPSIAGKDAPSVDELRYLIKYNNASQERCVTINDYKNRILMMPPRYGCPFRVGVLEENNKIMIYILMIDSNGNLSSIIPSTMIDNIQNYLSAYRSINDFVEIKSGRIINLSFEIDAYIDKTYDSNEVVKNIINTVKNYMDINAHDLGEDIYVGDIQKEVGNLDGVINVMDIRVYNNTGEGYSGTRISQETVGLQYNNDGYNYEYIEGNELEVDLETSDYILNSESDEMFEIKNPDSDIRVRVKAR